MIDHIQIRQLWNERRINLWLWVELMLVSVVLWYVVDWLYTTTYVYREPRGFNIENTYRLPLEILAPHSHAYTDRSGDDRKTGEDLLEIMNRLRRHPEIEAVSLSVSSYPYSMRSTGNSVETDTFHVNTFFRMGTVDFLKVFQYKEVNGESPEELISLLKEPHTFIGSNNLFQGYGIHLESFVGRSFCLGGDTTQHFRLVAATPPVKRSDFGALYGASYVFGSIEDNDIADMNDSGILFSELCLRTRSGINPGFMDRIRKDLQTHYRSGNLFIKDIQSMETVRHGYQLDEMNEWRNYLWGVGFLLVNIFLGLLGTFWFRTQQRKSELALRMSFGSSRRQIFFYLVKEGLLLLILATLPAIVIDHLLAINEYSRWLNGEYLEAGRFTVTVLITFVLIAVTIVAGICFPAYQATRIQPVVALREE